MKKVLVICIIVLLLVSVIGCASNSTTSTKPAASSTTSTEPIVWKVHTFIPEGTAISEHYYKTVAKLVEERSNGALKFELYYVGALVDPPNMTAAVSKGTIDMEINYPAADVGIVPEAYTAANLPFTWTDGMQFLDFWNNYQGGAALKKLDSVYNSKNLKLVALAVNHDSFGFMTKFPVNSIADFKGKKIRATGQYGSLLESLGASSVLLPLTETYTGLSTGVVDGAIMGWSGLEEYKWSEVLKYVIEPPFFSGGSLTAIVNMDSWNKLPDNLKTVVIEACYDANVDDFLPFADNYEKHIVTELIPKAGITISKITGDDLNTFKKSSLPMYDFVSKQSTTTAEIVQLMKDYMDSKGISYPK